MNRRYEIRILGHLGPLLRTTVDCMRSETVPPQITIRGRLSPDDLRWLLRLLDAHGITLVRLERAGRPRGDRARGPSRTASVRGEAG
jgi:hypothetical protein